VSDQKSEQPAVEAEGDAPARCGLPVRQPDVEALAEETLVIVD
jgi:hypothetical protein